MSESHDEQAKNPGPLEDLDVTDADGEDVKGGVVADPRAQGAGDKYKRAAGGQIFDDPFFFDVN